jgi:hypothetical protein
MAAKFAWDQIAPQAGRAFDPAVVVALREIVVCEAGSVGRGASHPRLAAA